MGDVSEGVVHATSIVDLTTWPDKERSTIFRVDYLLECFTPVLQRAGGDMSRIPDEWKVLKEGVSKHHLDRPK